MSQNFLDEILAKKREAITRIQGDNSGSQFRERALEIRKTAAPHRLLYALIGTSSRLKGEIRSARCADLTLKIIAEFKRRSPSAGIIRSDVSPADVARCYERGGACAISVLTDEEYFGGSLEDLIAIRATTDLPILRKDFVVNEIQIYEAAAAGADAVLLIAAALDHADLTKLRAIAEDELGLDALMEVHTSDELQSVLKAGARIIGVNNRDLRTFRTSSQTSERLIAEAPHDIVMVSESGLQNAESLRRLHELGFHGFLVGDTLMRASDPEIALRGLIAQAEAPLAGDNHLR